MRLLLWMALSAKFSALAFIPVSTSRFMNKNDFKNQETFKLFHPTQKNIATTTTTTSKISSSIGDMFAGITGSAPAKLDPPIDLLSGTTIDPSLSNVDLQCVYKGSKDGWSAVNFHNCVDGRGSALVVALNSSGKRFGG